MNLLHILQGLNGLCDDAKPVFCIYDLILWKIQDICNEISQREPIFSKFNRGICEAFIDACQQVPWMFDTEQWTYSLPVFRSLLDPRQMDMQIRERMSPQVASNWKEALMEVAAEYHIEAENADGSLCILNFNNEEEDIILDQKLVLGKPGIQVATTGLEDYFNEIPLDYTDITSYEPMLLWWDTHIRYHPEFGAAARDVFGVASSVEGSSLRLLGRNFEKLLSNR